MSKSRGNVITPDSIVETFGADTLRIYELFMAPFDQDVNWNIEGIDGARRFVNRVWTLYASGAYAESRGAKGQDRELELVLHKTIREVSERIATFRLNTMISTLMEFCNELFDRYQAADAWRSGTFHQALEVLMILLAPAAPFIAEELWQQTGHSGSVHQQNWPTWDPGLARDEMLQIAVQVNGKVRAVLELPAGADEAAVKLAAYNHPKVQQHLEGHSVTNEIFVKGKVFNVVTTKDKRRMPDDEG
jgi:leucyl-tRNA synthetase